MAIRPFRRGLVALLLTVALAACSAAPPAPQTSPQAGTPATGDATPAPGAQEGTEGYPAPGAAANPAYPGPDAAASSAYPGPGGEAAPVGPTLTPAPGRAPEPVPTPGPDTGVVHGMLYNATTDQPIYDSTEVYLSRVIPTDNSQMDAVSLDKTNDPFVIPDVEGGFAFANVPPGRYGIVVQAPINQYLARQASDPSRDLTFTVEAGQTVDLGKILAGYP